jgi:hypothetical protein
MRACVPIPALFLCATSLAIISRAHADSIPTLDATFASATDFYNGSNFEVSGPSFQFDGQEQGPSFTQYYDPGDPMRGSFSFESANGQPGPNSRAGGGITIDGTVYAASFSGGANGGFYSPNVFAGSPGDEGPFPATLTGTFSACMAAPNGLGCSTQFPNPIATISIDIPGEVTLDLLALPDPNNPTIYEVESVTFTTTPEPSNLVLLATCGVGLLVLFAVPGGRRWLRLLQ